MVVLDDHSSYHTLNLRKMWYWLPLHTTTVLVLKTYLTETCQLAILFLSSNFRFSFQNHSYFGFRYTGVLCSLLILILSLDITEEDKLGSSLTIHLSDSESTKDSTPAKMSLLVTATV